MHQPVVSDPVQAGRLLPRRARPTGGGALPKPTRHRHMDMGGAQRVSDPGRGRARRGGDPGRGRGLTWGCSGPREGPNVGVIRAGGGA